MLSRLLFPILLSTLAITGPVDCAKSKRSYLVAGDPGDPVPPDEFQGDTNGPPRYMLQHIGFYDHAAGPDHLMGTGILDTARLLVVSPIQIAAVDRDSLETSRVSQPLGTPWIIQDHPIPSNLDGVSSGHYTHKFFQVATYGTYAYVATRYDNLYVFAVTGVGNTTGFSLASTLLEPREFTESVLVHGDELWLTHHRDGIEVLDLAANPATPTSRARLQAGFADAWGITVQDNGTIWVADGAGGLKKVLRSGNTLSIVGGDTLANSPGVLFDVAVMGNRVLAAAGSAGLAIYDATSATLQQTFALPGVCLDVAPMDGERMAVACREWVHVVGFSPQGDPEVVASTRLHRDANGGENLSVHLASQVSVAGDVLYVAAWDFVDAFELIRAEPTQTPKIRLSSQRVHFAAAGQATIEIANVGTESLGLLEPDVKPAGAPVTCQPSAYALAPGETTPLNISYAGSMEDVAVTCVLESNDLDDRYLGVQVYAHLQDVVDPGEAAPDFGGNFLARDYATDTFDTSETFSLSGFQTNQRAAFFAVFGSWGPSCLPEMVDMSYAIQKQLPPGVELFLIAQEEPDSVVQHILEKTYLPLRIYLDNQGATVGSTLYQQPDVGRPFSRAFAVNPEGIATGVLTGYDPARALELIRAAAP